MQRNTGRSLLSSPDDESGGDDSEEWMTSYGDLVTLLLCFFILFFAEYKRRAEDTVLIQYGKTIHEIQNPTEEESNEQRAKAAMLSKIEAEVRSEMAQLEIEEVDMGIQRRRKEVLLRLYENDFFHIGSYNLKPNGKLVLERVAKLLQPFQDKVIIKVEGHSDSLPVNPFSQYQTNLNLSSLRASQAANTLISFKIEESRLRVVGFGSVRQLVEDRLPAAEGETLGKYDPAKGLKNRRIEIRIQIEDPEADKSIDLAF